MTAMRDLTGRRREQLARIRGLVEGDGTSGERTMTFTELFNRVNGDLTATGNRDWFSVDVRVLGYGDGKLLIEYTIMAAKLKTVEGATAEIAYANFRREMEAHGAATPGELDGVDTHVLEERH